MIAEGATARLEGTPTEAGSFTFRATAKDLYRRYVTRQFTIEVMDGAVVQMSAFSMPGFLWAQAIALPDAAEGMDYMQTLFSPDEWSGSYSLEGTLPLGLEYDAALYSLVGTPEAGSAGDYLFTIRVDNNAYAYRLCVVGDSVHTPAEGTSVYAAH